MLQNTLAFLGSFQRDLWKPLVIVTRLNVTCHVCIKNRFWAILLLDKLQRSMNNYFNNIFFNSIQKKENWELQDHTRDSVSEMLKVSCMSQRIKLLKWWLGPSTSYPSIRNPEIATTIADQTVKMQSETIRRLKTRHVCTCKGFMQYFHSG